ncbi:hypothetical protein EC991_000512 [Linnemannia zychae]|nr:hypothetical protein EC991_000512 [Linnemannia zychae]
MPTYGPVPASFSALSHHSQVRFLYRHILRQGASFFDERASHWIRVRAQETFRKNQSQKDKYRTQKYMSDARKALRLIERANQMDLKAIYILVVSFNFRANQEYNGFSGFRNNKGLYISASSDRTFGGDQARPGTSLPQQAEDNTAYSFTASGLAH